MRDIMKCEFSAKSANESFARIVVASFVAKMDPTVEELAEIKTAVSEAVTNVIIHGYKGKNGTVYIECEIRGNILTVIITDKGEGIADIPLARTPMFTTNPDGERSGMGFTVMETFMDEVSVASLPGAGTSVLMRKKLKSCGEDEQVG